MPADKTPTLDSLTTSSILYVHKEGPDTFKVGEACDYYYSRKLTRAEFAQLIAELTAMLNDTENSDAR